MPPSAIMLQFALAFAVFAAPRASAQPHGQHGAMHHGSDAAARHPPDPGRPYAALLDRRIKALADAQVSDLLAGRGMGLALAAEMNGYPGPAHVLEHAEALGLTPAERARAEGLRDAMAAEARALGSRIVALEEELDALFAQGQANAGRLAVLTAALGALNGRLRETHLVAHIGMRNALSEAQRTAYARLRGYARRPDGQPEHGAQDRHLSSP